MSGKRHGLLARQLKKSFGSEDRVPESLAGFLEAVDAAYRQSDEDREMLERSLELSSRELLAGNDEIRALLQAFPDALFRIDAGGVVLECSVNRPDRPSLPLAELAGRPVQAALPPDQARRFEAALAAVRETGEASPLEFSLKTPSGERSWEARLVRARDGRLLMIARDITERAAAQEALRRSEEKLRQAQKVDGIGRLAGGIAHDFNNLLTTILGFADLAAASLGPDHPVAADVREISATGRRAADLTRRLLAFSRRQVIAPRVVSFNDVIPGISTMLRRLIGEDIELVTRLAPGLGAVLVDPGQVEQVVVNLCVNARDAMPGGGRLEIETGNVELDEAFVRENPGAAVGDFVRLSVRDGGEGMSDEVKAHLFEPFFTTKELGRGTGLGLATCYGITKQNGGYITVASEAGRGTVVSLYLPRIHGAVPEAPNPGEAAPLPRGTETLLVVEDEQAVRSLAVRILEQQGYAVLSARDGLEGLEVVRKDTRREIRLILTDMVMPRAGGRAVADGIARSRPDIRVLAMTGYSAPGALRDEASGERLAVLHKPFSPSDLATRVRAMLDA
ncbi:MAG: ATP-binding protein [Elusimicrobiota bacterium]|nr:MAG: ATP-binding protein [Elusimicrobiota bacterium]